jgi:hypothetical protein
LLKADLEYEKECCVFTFCFDNFDRLASTMMTSDFRSQLNKSMQSIADIRSMKKEDIPTEMEFNSNRVGDEGVEEESEEEVMGDQDFDTGMDNFLPFELRVLDSILESYVTLKREELRTVEENVRKYSLSFNHDYYSTRGHVSTF